MFAREKQVVLLSLEGNIGAGKSTLLNKLKEAHPEWFFVDEPVDKWLATRDTATGKSILELFYEDKKRWAFTFQTVAVQTRAEAFRTSLNQVREASGARHVVVMERCLNTDSNVFAKELRFDGSLTALEWDLYKQWRTVIEGRYELPALDGYVWLDASPDVCAERIRGRARQGEEQIPLDYLKNLNGAHRDWLGAAGPGMVYRTSDVAGVEAFVESLFRKKYPGAALAALLP